MRAARVATFFLGRQRGHSLPPFCEKRVLRDSCYDMNVYLSYEYLSIFGKIFDYVFHIISIV